MSSDWSVSRCVSSDWSVFRSLSSDWSVSGSRDLVRHFEWGDNSGFRALFGIFGRILLFWVLCSCRHGFGGDSRF